MTSKTDEVFPPYRGPTAVSDMLNGWPSLCQSFRILSTIYSFVIPHPNIEITSYLLSYYVKCPMFIFYFDIKIWKNSHVDHYFSFDVIWLNALCTYLPNLCYIFTLSKNDRNMSKLTRNLSFYTESYFILASLQMTNSSDNFKGGIPNWPELSTVINH